MTTERLAGIAQRFAIAGKRSSQFGFSTLISRIFQLRFHFFNRFSRRIAFSIVVELFEIYEAMDAVASSEAGHCARLVLVHSANKIVRDADRAGENIHPI